MRILLLGDTYLPERAAAAVRASELAERWTARGHTVTVVTGNPHYPEGRIFSGYANRLFVKDEVNGVPVQRIFTVPYDRGAIVKRIFNQILFGFLPALLDRAGGADIVVGTSPPLTIGLSAWMMARRRGVPFVFDVRDLYPAAIEISDALNQHPLIRLFRSLEAFVYRKASRITVASRFWAEKIIAQGVQPEKVLVIPNGANVSRFRPAPANGAVRARYGIAADRFLVGYVGLMGLAHGAMVILEAAERLRDSPGIHFLFVGEGSDKQAMMHRARSMGLKNTTFSESVPPEEVPRILQACDAGVATLKRVEFTRGMIPVKLFEMMACGLPVLFSGWGESEEIVRSSEAGLVVPCEDGAGLAAAARELAGDRQRARVMGEKGRAFVELNFSRKKSADRYEELLTSIVTDLSGPAEEEKKTRLQ